MKHFCESLMAMLLIAALLAGSGLSEGLALDNRLRGDEQVSTLDGSDGGEASALEVTGRSWKKKVVVMNWFKGGSNVLKKGAYGYIYDIKTGTVVRIKRMGGTYHADVEPATKKDTAKLKKIAGGSFSWDRHAVILYAGGKFVACSINTMPHGDQTITNNGYNGQFCLHMAYSRTHGSSKVDADHMAAIKRAYNWAH